MRNKRASLKHPRPSGKRARGVAAAEDFDSRTPLWKFEKIDMEGPFGWENVDGETARRIKDHLVRLESMTWADIKRQTHDNGKSSNHFLSIDKITREALERLKTIFHEENRPDELFSLRLTNRKRILGLLERGVFSILWWDPEHGVAKTKG